MSCQSGRGRSGTFSALILGTLLNASTHSELTDIIVGIRENRDGLVETPEQYRFVAESLSIPAPNVTSNNSISCGGGGGSGGSTTVVHHHYMRSSVELFAAFIVGALCAVVGTLVILRRKSKPGQSTTYQSIVDNSIHNSSL